MEQNDFILREIAKIGAMLRALIKRMVEVKEKDAEIVDLNGLSAELLEETGIDLNLLLESESGELESILDKYESLNLINLELLADLIAYLSSTSDEPERSVYSKRAIEIYLILDKMSSTFSIERAQKIKKLTK